MVPELRVAGEWQQRASPGHRQGSQRDHAALKGPRSRYLLLILTVIGISLLMGDGVLTPAISILSAVEGLPLIPGLEGIGTDLLVLLAAGIAIALFYFQHHGTERVAFAFGPVMVVWFAALTLSGLVLIAQVPSVLM